MQKILSVIVPSYNMEKHLARGLSSFILPDEQMAALEVIVVNDGSTDGTSRIAHEYSERYPETYRVIDKKNGNYGSCANVGLAAASGKFVKMLDADDYYERENLVEYLELLDATDADLVLSDFDFVHEDGKRKSRTTYKLPDGIFSFGEIPDYICGVLQMPAVAYRTEKVKALGYRQTEGISYTDQEWMFLPMASVSRAVYFRKVIYKYFVGRDGQTIDFSVRLKRREMVLDIVRGLSKLYAERRDEFLEDGRRYLRIRLLSQLHSLYSICLLEPVRFEQIEKLRELDNYLAAHLSDIYTSMEAFESANHARFRFVKQWRKRQNDADVAFRVYRFICKVKRWVKMV